MHKTQNNIFIVLLCTLKKQKNAPLKDHFYEIFLCIPGACKGVTINCSQEFEPEAREDLTHSLRGVKEAMRQIWGKQGRLGGIYKGGWGEERKFLLYVSGET